MHGDVGAALFQRHFQLLDEQALAAHLAQRAVQDLVARVVMPSRRPVASAAQQGLHMFGLPQGQAAFAGGDGDGCETSWPAGRNLLESTGLDASINACQK
jgi:hypothetical protein